MRARAGTGFRRWLTISALVALGAFPERAAQAEGVALRWNHCFGEAGAESVRHFACDTNTGSEALVGSFVLGADVSRVTGIEVVVDVLTYGGIPGAPTGDPLPAWWQFKNTGSCRLSALSLSTVPDPSNGTCQPLWNGQEVGAIAAYRLDPLGPGSGRILLVVAEPSGAEVQALAGVVYDVFTLRINHSRTVGPTACDGCLVPMQVWLHSLNVATPLNADNRYLASGLEPLSEIVLWAPQPVPTRRSRWGAVKSLFR